MTPFFLYIFSLLYFLPKVFFEYGSSCRTLHKRSFFCLEIFIFLFFDWLVGKLKRYFVLHENMVFLIRLYFGHDIRVDVHFMRPQFTNYFPTTASRKSRASRLSGESAPMERRIARSRT